MSGTKNLVIEKGATFNTIFTWSTKVGAVTTPVDLTGWSARSMIKEDYTATPVVSLTTSANGGITLGGTSGTIALTIAATATSAITIDGGYWDLELEDTLGNVTRLLEGTVTFKPEVTK